MTKKQRNCKLAKRRHHQAESRRRYWVEFNKPRSVMEMFRHTTVQPPDEVGFTMSLRSPYGALEEHMQRRFPISATK